MGKSDEYRRKEREAMEVAQRLSLIPDRSQYLAIARAWRELAERAEASEQAAEGDG